MTNKDFEASLSLDFFLYNSIQATPDRQVEITTSPFFTATTAKKKVLLKTDGIGFKSPVDFFTDYLLNPRCIGVNKQISLILRPNF